MFIAAAAIVAVACTPTQEQETKPEDNLNITSTTFVIPFSGGTQDIVFKTNADWTITSDKDFVTFDRASGSAGTITVTMTVAENLSFEPRTADVTVKSGDKQTVFKVQQAAVAGVETSIVYNVSEAAQDIEIEVLSNVAYIVEVDENSPWLTVAQTKAEPSSGVIKIHVAANTSLGPRTGGFSIGNDNFRQNYEVIQSAAWTPTVSASATYISNSQKPYDSVNYVPTHMQQYVIDLETEDGAAIELVINKDGFTYNEETYAYEGEYFDATVLPEGEYEIDATGQYADNTFSIKTANGTEAYYTRIELEGREIAVVDGQIGVVATDEGYAITAALIDAVGNQYNYSYEGAISIENEFFGNMADPSWKNTYDTYFTTKANGWSIYFYLPYTGGDRDLNYVSFTFYTAAGEVNLDEFPVGTFTYGEASEDADIAYKNGKTLANPGLMTYVYTSFYNDSRSVNVTDGGTLTISKNDDGTYNFVWNGKVQAYSWNDDYSEQILGEEEAVSIDIDVAVGKSADNTSHPTPDGDAVFETLEGPAGELYVGYWYGSHIGSTKVEDTETMNPAVTTEEGIEVPCNVFSIGSNSYFNGAWSGFFSVVSDAAWTYVKNFNNRFCNTPVNNGTYTFGEVAKIGALIPLKAGNASRCYIQNTYTGTTYYPVSGSITISTGKISVDLTCKATSAGLVGRADSPETVKFTGSTGWNCQYHQDWSAINRVRTLSILSPVQ